MQVYKLPVDHVQKKFGFLTAEKDSFLCLLDKRLYYWNVDGNGDALYNLLIKPDRISLIQGDQVLHEIKEKYVELFNPNASCGIGINQQIKKHVGFNFFKPPENIGFVAIGIGDYGAISIIHRNGRFVYLYNNENRIYLYE